MRTPTLLNGASFVRLQLQILLLLSASALTEAFNAANFNLGRAGIPQVDSCYPGFSGATPMPQPTEAVDEQYYLPPTTPPLILAQVHPSISPTTMQSEPTSGPRYPLANTNAHDSPDKDIANIFAQNQEWKNRKLAQDPFFFNKLGSVHKPKYMWIGCADARVPANEIMGEDAGSVFVVRNVANLVVNTDFNLMSALQYAVNVLKVDHIIVCGHYDCGGVRASLEAKDHVPPLENWLRNIRDVYRLHRDELNAIRDPETRHRRLVELNVIEQCLNLFKTGSVQRRRIETFRQGNDYTTPRIHACVFDPKVGILNRLPVNFKDYIRDLHNIYDLYTLDDMTAAASSNVGTPLEVDVLPRGGHSSSITQADATTTFHAGGRKGSVRIRSSGPGDVTVDFNLD